MKFFLFFSLFIFMFEFGIAKEEKQNKVNEDLVGGIAVLVNNSPITTFEILTTSKTLNINNDQALEVLIGKKLKEEEIRRLNINVSDSEVEAQISQIAAQNQISIEQLFNELLKQGMNINDYKSKIKEQILDHEFIRNILSSSGVSQEDALRKYYNDNINAFKIPKIVKTISFNSSSKDDLINLVQQITKKNIKNMDDILKEKLKDGISAKLENINKEKASSNLMDLFVSTQEGNFTPVVQNDNNFIVFYVYKKEDIETVEFNNAKNYIIQKLISENQDRILKDYFEEVKSRSKIVYLR